MKEPKKNLYEGMYIISARLGEEGRKRMMAKLEELVTSQGGEVHKVHDWGRRRLAYEVAGQREGYYVIMYFSVPTPAINILWREYHLSEDLLRFLTLRTEKVVEKIEFKSLVEQ